MTSPTTRSATAGTIAEPSRARQPLLVATTGRGATPVVTAARLIADRLGAAPAVVAVLEPVPVYLPGLVREPTRPIVDAEQRRRLQDGVADAVRSAYDGDPAWPITVETGEPARTLVRVAQERGARLIVMGIGRHAPMDRMFGSETALQTIRLADRPVLAVAPSFAALPRRAVVAMDFSAASVRAAEEALALLADGGTLSLVYVRPHDIDLVRLGDEYLQWQHGARVDELFDRVAAALRAPPTITVRRLVMTGEPAEQVIEVARRDGADLVAAGSSGLGFLDRLIVGSVATRLLRRADVSVLVVPRPSAADVERIERQLAESGDLPEAARWPAMLEQFSRRNAGRPTRLEIDDPAIGAQIQQSGYTLLGASYDRRDDRLELMLGAPGGGAHLTHSIGGVRSIAVLADPDLRDEALQARHGDGQTILVFRD